MATATIDMIMNPFKDRGRVKAPEQESVVKILQDRDLIHAIEQFDGYHSGELYDFQTLSPSQINRLLAYLQSQRRDQMKVSLTGDFVGKLLQTFFEK